MQKNFLVELIPIVPHGRDKLRVPDLRVIFPGACPGVNTRDYILNIVLFDENCIKFAF